MEEQVKFEKNVVATGQSHAITIPQELMVFLGLEKGDTVFVVGDTGKHGNFLAVWKKKVE